MLTLGGAANSPTYGEKVDPNGLDISRPPTTWPEGKLMPHLTHGSTEQLRVCNLGRSLGCPPADKKLPHMPNGCSNVSLPLPFPSLRSAVEAKVLRVLRTDFAKKCEDPAKPAKQAGYEI